MEKTFSLTIVRHGQTSGNVEHMLHGHTDCPLNEVGLKQAKAAGEALKDVRFTKAISSDLKRAHVTCQTIIGENLHSKIDIITNEALREKFFGVFEGKPIAEMKVLAAKEGFARSYEYTPEGGESLADASNRARTFFKEEILSKSDSIKNDDHVLIVSHGGFMRRLFKVFHEEYNCSIELVEALSPDRPPDGDYEVKNTCWSRFRISMENESIKSFECLEFCNADHIIGIQ